MTPRFVIFIVNSNDETYQIDLRNEPTTRNIVEKIIDELNILEPMDFEDHDRIFVYDTQRNLITKDWRGDDSELFEAATDILVTEGDD